MSIRHLDALFSPQSIAVIGASKNPESIGTIVWNTVYNKKFKGEIWAVNPKYNQLGKHPVFAKCSDLPGKPSVALVCTPSKTWLTIFRQLGKKGTRVVILMSSMRNKKDRMILEKIRPIAKQYQIRIVGPSSLGSVTPALNAYLGAPAYQVKAGHVALISQSNTVMNAIYGWAYQRGLGFSHAIALGEETDVDAADIIDYLAGDPNTRAILLEIDRIPSARKFMSAARAAARNKPILAVRTGRYDVCDALYTAAFQRAGIVRLDSFDDLVEEIETLSVGKMVSSETGTLITSDEGVAKLAIDAFYSAGATLTKWNDETKQTIAQHLPHASIQHNALLLGNDAKPEDFQQAIQILAPLRHMDSLFVIHATSHLAHAKQVAQILIENKTHIPRGIMACFFAGIDSQTRDQLHVHHIAVHTTPHTLAHAYKRLINYHFTQQLLTQTPEMLPSLADQNIKLAHQAIHKKNEELTGTRAEQWLAHFSFMSAKMIENSDKSTINIELELNDHPQFGPVFRLSFPSIDHLCMPHVLYDLPPFNAVLMRHILSRNIHTKHVPIEPLIKAFSSLYQIVCDIEELVFFQMTLHIRQKKAFLISPKLRFGKKRSRFAITPYPRYLEKKLQWNNTFITLRPIRPEDEQAHRDLIAHMTPEDLRMRFFGIMRNFDQSQLARMTQIDYHREMAFIATTQENHNPLTLGVVRAITDADNDTAEFAIAIRANQKNKGLGQLLMSYIIDYSKLKKTKCLIGEALRENKAMIQLAKKNGFTIIKTDDPDIVGFKRIL